MSVRSFGEIVAALKPKKCFRSGQPVRRHSYYEGTVEGQIWRPIAGGKKRGARRLIGAVLKSARELERRTRRERQKERPGCRNGVLGQVGLDVLEALYDFVDFATGRLEPAVETIAEKVGHSYSAVHAALCRLRAAGFLHWIRRSRPTDNAGEAGPQVEQITNAYALLVPEKLQGLIAFLMRKAPAPADAVWQRQQRKEEHQAMLAQLTCVDFQADFGRDDAINGSVLSRIAILVDEREFSRA